MLIPKVEREHERKRVLWNVELRQGDRIWDCQAVDISAGGAKIRIAAPLPINSRVVLAVERLGDLEGEILWQNHAFAGLRFLESPEVVEERLRSVALSKGGVSHGKRRSSSAT